MGVVQTIERNDMNIIERKNLNKIQPNTKYNFCCFYLESLEIKDLKNVAFQQCSFRGETHLNLRGKKIKIHLKLHIKFSHCSNSQLYRPST
ncbi:hypothetical protein UABAM_02864 [Candidatus Uabimicrobium amorphum]|uniref:Uncharacterized protein n=1 Tax=Uabimicrobium amorphum TaxID=2596890 RepID=A0A5S9IM95_UABAM|nr:hypothetical protein UABAM_02864 [Candidatus Uabimicrobium amorphum]